MQNQATYYDLSVPSTTLHGHSYTTDGPNLDPKQVVASIPNLQKVLRGVGSVGLL